MMHQRAHALLTAAVLALVMGATAAQAGYEQPCFIDGCQSIDGRFVITAEHVEKGKSSHGPNKWHFTWKDTKTGETNTFDAQGVQGGQVYAHLFIAPDGQTFALWNHVTLYWVDKSFMHASEKLPPRAETADWRNQDVFSHRLIIYRKDGSIINAVAGHVRQIVQHLLQVGRAQAALQKDEG